MNSANDKQRKALGKGLSTLLPGRAHSGAPAAAVAVAPSAVAKPGTLALSLIQPNPMQPRTVFNSDGLEELAASIRANGIIQPLIVRHGVVVHTVGAPADPLDILAAANTSRVEASTAPRTA